jgi:hypothetical protein
MTVREETIIMAKTVVGLFDTAAEAQSVVQELTNSGFQREEISLVANDARGEYANYRSVGGTESSAAEGAGAGAVGGGVLGGVLGLLVGIGALAIPGIGPVVAAGPLVAALTGAGIGAAAGGLIGALVGAGIPEEDAGFYAEGVRRGGTLVMVKTSDDMAQRAYDVMQRYGAVDVDERSGTWRETGWSGFDPNAQPYTGSTDIDEKWERSSKIGTAGGAAAGAATGAAIGSVAGPVGTAVGGVAGAAAGAGIGAAGDVAGESIEDAYGRYDTDFRTHYQSNATSSGYTYEQYTPVYRYGYGLANDPMYRDREWADIEGDARRRWEERNPNTWEQFKDSVRYAWDKARGAR